MINRLAFLVVLLFLPFVIKAQGNRVPIYHTVQQGEWYSKIAPKYNTKVDSLEKWNPNVKSKSLQVGQRIIVGWEEVDEKQEQDEKIEKTPEMTLESEAKQPKGDTNVTPKDEPAPKLEPPVVDPDPIPSHSYSWVWLLLGLLIGMVLGAFLLYVLFANKLRAELEHKENELSRLNYNLTSEKSSAGSELSRLHSRIKLIEQKNKDLDNENNSLREEIAQLKTAQQRVSEYRTERTSPINTNQVSNETSGSSKTLYADAIIDDCFVKVRETPNEDSIFILHLNGENTADFSIYKSAYQRVVANPSFLEGCEKQILGDIMQLEIVSEGKAQREVSNGKWKVINKLNVLIK